MLNGYTLIYAIGPILGVIGTIVAQRGSSVAQRWLNRGSVESSDARILWEENRQLRTALLDENKRLRDECQKLGGLIKELEAKAWQSKEHSQ